MPKFKITKTDEGKRVDIVITRHLPEFSRSSLRSLFDKNLVLFKTKPIKPSHKLSYGDIVSLDTSLLTAAPEQIDIPIIYEDDDVVVMDKPAGLLTHSKGALNLESTVAGFLAGKISDKRMSGNRAGIVHRLDRVTSGLIIGAKHTKALGYLQKQFSSRKVKKTYIAIVEGRPEPQAAMIDAPLERNPKQPQTFRVGTGGKPAQTEYRVIKTFEKDGKTYSEVELKPITGRTHQIRVHMAYIGHPLAGDKVYGHEGLPVMLNASELELTLPNGQRQTFKAPLPKIFEDFTNL